MLLLEDHVQDRNQPDGPAGDVGILHAEHVLQLKLGGDAQLVEVGEFAVDDGHRFVRARVADILGEDAADQRPQRLDLRQLGLPGVLEHLPGEGFEILGVLGVLHG